MSIRIQPEVCVGCGRCVEVCPGNLIKLADRKAVIRRPEDCWGCTSCLKECAFGAIRFYLGADIGGRGGEMHTVREGPLTHWIIETVDSDPVTITVDSRDANKY